MFLLELNSIFLFFVFVFCWRDNSGRVRTHEKNSGDSVRRFGIIIQKFFCAQSGASIDRLVGNGLVSRYPRALLPALENFVRALFPDPTDCPWISEDGRPHVNYWVTRRTLIIWAWPKRLVLTQKCNRNAIRANVNKASKQAKRAECLPWNVEEAYWKESSASTALHRSQSYSQSSVFLSLRNLEF